MLGLGRELKAVQVSPLYTLEDQYAQRSASISSRKSCDEGADEAKSYPTPGGSMRADRSSVDAVAREGMVGGATEESGGKWSESRGRRADARD